MAIESTLNAGKLLLGGLLRSSVINHPYIPQLFTMTFLSFVGNKEYHKVSDEFEIGPYLTMDCGVEHLKKKSPWTYNGIKVVSNVALFFKYIFFFLAGNKNVHKSLDDFEI